MRAAARNGKRRRDVWEQQIYQLIVEGRARRGHLLALISAEALRDAIFPLAGATPKEKAVHFLNVPWKLMFAIVPPPGMCGGVPCFLGGADAALAPWPLARPMGRRARRVQAVTGSNGAAPGLPGPPQ